MFAFVWCGSFDIHLGVLTGCCILLGSVTACRYQTGWSDRPCSFHLGGLGCHVWLVSCLVLSHIFVATTNLCNPSISRPTI
mgnify:CR=1 FL=1